MNIAKVKNKLITISFIGSLLFGCFNVSYAADSDQRCDPTIASNLVKASFDKRQQILKRMESGERIKQSYLNDLMNQVGCADIFMEGINITLPNIDAIIQKIKDKIIREACNLARDTVRNATKDIPNSLSLETSTIPGVSELGLGSALDPSISLTKKPQATINVKGESASSVGGVWDSIKGSL